MKIYTIETETNNITVHTTVQEAEAIANADRFRNQAGLAKLAADWPMTRLVEIWNSLPGAERVKKFKDRSTAVERIWKAIQSLSAAPSEASEPVDAEPATLPTEAPQTPDVAPEVAPSGKNATRAKKAPKRAPEAAASEATTLAAEAPHASDVAPEPKAAGKKASRAKKTTKHAAKAKGTREGSKTDMVLGLLKRDGGVTAKELMSTLGWQAHSVRGFISGTVGRKLGLTVVSTKAENGERTYEIKA
jgi:hypothetical protein